ncbi:hypothetical protein ISCGN_021027 [Ixodes scapularis]
MDSPPNISMHACAIPRDWRGSCYCFVKQLLELLPGRNVPEQKVHCFRLPHEEVAAFDQHSCNMSMRSSRKMLPATPEGVGSHCLQPLERRSHGGHAYGPVFLEYSLMSEYLLLMKQQLSGVYVMPSASSAFMWFGVLFIRQGLYQGGVFRFTLHIPDSYPEGDCPDLVFEPPIFHPLVDIGTGELDIKRNFQKWSRGISSADRQKGHAKILWTLCLLSTFVWDFARISAPLTNLTKDAEMFEWAEEQQQAFAG